MEDKRYIIEIEVLTPLSVGAGNENDLICGADYVQHGGRVYVLDMDKISQLGVDIGRLATVFANGDQQAVINIIGANRLGKAASRIFDATISTTNPIKSFIRTQLYDKPVIPGSSIKGAIRSCLFNHFHGRKQNGEILIGINDKVFGTMKTGDVFTRFIQVGDIVLPRTQLVNTKLFNLQSQGGTWKGGWKHGGQNTTSSFQPFGFNTLYECVVPKEKGIGVIELKNVAYDLLKRNVHNQSNFNLKSQLMLGGIKALFHIVNQTTKHYLQKEERFFNHYAEGTDRVEDVLDCIHHVLDLIPQDDSYCVMKMSAGAGFHSITGDWIYDDYIEEPGMWTTGRNGGKKKYKSRKIAQYGDKLKLMGLVIMRVIDDSGEEKYHSHLNQMKIPEAQLQREAEFLRCKEREEKERQLREQAALLKRDEEQYDMILSEAIRLAETRKWDEAISKAQEASRLMPNKEDHKSWIANWESLKVIDAARQADVDASIQKFRQPLAVLLEKTSSLGNVIGTTKKWIALNGSIDAFGQAELDAMAQAVKRLPSKEVKQLENKRKDLIKAIGEQWATCLLKLCQ